MYPYMGRSACGAQRTSSGRGALITVRWFWLIRLEMQTIGSMVRWNELGEGGVDFTGHSAGPGNRLRSF